MDALSPFDLAYFVAVMVFSFSVRGSAGFGGLNAPLLMLVMPAKIIVPALVMFSGMGMQRAIGTSLLVITLISTAGTASHVLAGKDLTLATAALFTIGSIAGLFAGSGLARRLAGPTLQKVFAAAIVAVASYVIFRTMAGLQ